MRLVPDENYCDGNPTMFRWMKGEKRVATIALYAEGLVEFDGKHEVAIECIGEDTEAIDIEGLEIHHWK